MTLAKRSIVAIVAAFLSMTIGAGLFAANDVAYAATTTGKTLAAAKAAVSKSDHATTEGNKMALAAAAVSYSRAVYRYEGTGTRAYLAVCKKYLGSYYAQNNKQMQCNVPVAAAVRFSGVDRAFPTTCQGMYDYMNSSEKWKRLKGTYKGKTSSLKPGDVLIRIGGVTTYVDEYGARRTASTNHACMYVGKDIASSVYKKFLKGTEADKGKPGSTRVFVSAHLSSNDASRRSASCMETASQAYADRRMVVFRYVG